MLSPHKADKLKNNPSKLWWLFAVILLSVFILVQLPISWVVQKYIPNSPYLQWVSGNLWKGSANWQTTKTSIDGNTSHNSTYNSGTIKWQWKPLKLFLGKISADVNITSGKSRLKGQVNAGLGMNSVQLRDFKGVISQETLSNFLNWQLPDAPILVNNLSINFDKKTGFEDAGGQLTWVGGQLGYPNAGEFLQINMPAMKANISSEKTNEGSRLHAHLINDKEKTLGNFYLDNSGMLDVGLTQRLLENMPDYSGSAPQDTAVVSIRQPLLPESFAQPSQPNENIGSAPDNNQGAN